MDFEEIKKEEQKLEKISNLFVQLKRVNYYYQIVDEKQKEVLLDNSEFIIQQLVCFGYDRTFLETLIIGGKDFLESCIEHGMDLGKIENIKIIFS